MIKVITGARQAAQAERKTGRVAEGTPDQGKAKDEEATHTVAGQKQSGAGSADAPGSSYRINRSWVDDLETQGEARREKEKQAKALIQAREDWLTSRGGPKVDRLGGVKQFDLSPGPMEVTQDESGTTRRERVYEGDRPQQGFYGRQHIRTDPYGDPEKIHGTGQFFAGAGKTVDDLDAGLANIEAKSELVEFGDPEADLSDLRPGAWLGRRSYENLLDIKVRGEKQEKALKGILTKMGGVEFWSQRHKGYTGHNRELWRRIGRGFGEARSPSGSTALLNPSTLTEEELRLYEDITHGTIPSVPTDPKELSFWIKTVPADKRIEAMEWVGQKVLKLYNNLFWELEEIAAEMARREAKASQLDSAAALLKQQRKALLKSQEE